MKALSKNEKIALELTAQGLKNREIANQMTDKNNKYLSEKTVSTYLRRVRKKLEIPMDKNTYYLVVRAIELNVILKPDFSPADRNVIG